MPDKRHPAGGSGHVNDHGIGPADEHDHDGEDADLVVELDQDEQDQITVALADSLGTLMREYVRGDCSYEDLTIEVFATLQALISVREGELPLEWLDLLNQSDDDDVDGTTAGPGADANGVGNLRDDDGLLWLRGKPGE